MLDAGYWILDGRYILRFQVPGKSHLMNVE